MSSSGSSAPPLVGMIPPPPGGTPNFVNPESQAGLEVVFAILLPTLAGLVVLMRLWSRLWITRAVWWDDCQ